MLARASREGKWRPNLTLRLDLDVVEGLRREAEAHGLSVSKYVSAMWREQSRRGTLLALDSVSDMR